MTTPILHHYPTSPYGEVIRTALGLKGVAWESVEQSVIMPRPFLTPLTGGYRRIPVLQIGADIYCDTQLILRELDQRFPNAPLVKAGAEASAWMMRGYSERVWFQISVAVIFAEIGEHIPEAFKADRKQLSGRDFDVAGMRAVAPMMQDQWRAIASWADVQLSQGGPFLGGKAADITDLSVWLNVWFLRGAAPATFLALTADMPALTDWSLRMDAIGHGVCTPLPPDQALAKAAAVEPEKAPRTAFPHEAQGLTPGMQAVVRADDYGRDPIAGVIHRIDANRVSLWRDTVEAGRVVTHFPRAGFSVQMA